MSQLQTSICMSKMLILCSLHNHLFFFFYLSVGTKGKRSKDGDLRLAAGSDIIDMGDDAFDDEFNSDSSHRLNELTPKRHRSILRRGVDTVMDVGNTIWDDFAPSARDTFRYGGLLYIQIHLYFLVRKLKSCAYLNYKE